MDPRLHQLIVQSDALRRAGDWVPALQGYQRARVALPQDAVLAHNQALCHLALGQGEQAVLQSQFAVSRNPKLWQSSLIQAKALVACGRKTEALALLEQLGREHPANPDICIELAKLLLQHGGDAARAVRLVQPWRDSGNKSDAQAVALISQLYDRDEAVTAEALSQDLCAFAERHLQLDELPGQAREEAAVQRPGRARGSQRPRVGLLSTQFSVSPVYFFTYGAFNLLANDVDLVFFSRAPKNDWGTQAFRQMASDWVDVSLCSSEELAKVLRAHDLDVLIDLGGWMDPVGLRALSVKPARRMYKWVGGQSATTGLKTFDGFFTDRYQTPKGADALFSEPLIRLKAGYVTYTPPPYMPKPVRPRGKLASFGVIANPAKVSRSFLAELRDRVPVWSHALSEQGLRLGLAFIDQRYQQDSIRARIEAALPGLDVTFVTPADHVQYLNAVARLDATLDTWPYSGGLTTIEALALGVPSFTRTGELFCERHTISHCMYAGLKLGECSWTRFEGIAPRELRGRTLLAADSKRCNHELLARELLSYLKK